MYYASRALSETEKRYAVIEEKALAVTRACEKFINYILGMKFTVETEMPPRILRFRMHLMKYKANSAPSYQPSLTIYNQTYE